MKSIYPYLTLIALLFSACQNTSNHQQENQYQIVIQENADSLDIKAADVLQQWWYRISKKNIAILHQKDASKNNIFIGQFGADKALQDSIHQLKPDGFINAPLGKDIVLAGKTPLSNMYAVCHFLEQECHCMIVSPNHYYAPKQDNIELSHLVYKSYEPDFDFRRVHLPGQFNQEYRWWYHLEELNQWGMFVHTFKELLPPETYFESHPEYYSYIGGRRLQDAQLCLSNPEVIELLKQNLKKEMLKQPDKKMWSVSQNDAYNYCECENCKLLYQKYDAYSRAYITMANALAKAFPDKIISTLAYQFTRKAPKHIKIEPNVNIMFCSIECNRSQPFVEDKRSADFVRDMEEWSALTHNIFLWDYVVQFKNYLCPFPNFHIFQSNLDFFKSAEVRMIFEQGSGAHWSDLSELKQYILSKLVWNTQSNVDSLIDVFLPAYYGKASPYIKAYYELLHQNLIANANRVFLNIYGYPSDYKDAFLQPQQLEKYNTLMNQAEQAVQDDSLYLKRVWKTRLPLDFAYLDIALNGKDTSLSYFEVDTTSNRKHIKTKMLNRLQQLKDRSLLFKDVIVNERLFSVPDYCAYVRHKLKRQSAPNLLKEANIKLQTPYSKQYEVGGVKALTDDLLGDLDFHHNWLGFYGEDISAIIEFKTPKTFRTIQMNFLKAVNSWVFLPKEVRILVSDNGVDFKTLATQKGDVSDQNYLVKSVPFDFHLQETTARFIKIQATSLKQCPEWHRGFGNPSWLFIDEISVY